MDRIFVIVADLPFVFRAAVTFALTLCGLTLALLPIAGLYVFREEKLSWPWRDSNPDRTTLSGPTCSVYIQFECHSYYNV
jgi:hypothetical protein